MPLALYYVSIRFAEGSLSYAPLSTSFCIVKANRFSEFVSLRLHLLLLSCILFVNSLPMGKVVLARPQEPSVMLLCVYSRRFCLPGSYRIIFSIPTALAVAAYNISRHINIPQGNGTALVEKLSETFLYMAHKWESPSLSMSLFLYSIVYSALLHSKPFTPQTAYNPIHDTWYMYILHPLSRRDLTNGAACKARARIYYTELGRPTIELPRAKHPFDYTYLLSLSICMYV